MDKNNLMSVTVSITFKNGVGNITATLQYDTNKPDETQTSENSGDITFAGAGPGDSITTTVTCTGTAELSLDVDANRTYPVIYKAGKTDDVFYI